MEKRKQRTWKAVFVSFLDFLSFPVLCKWYIYTFLLTLLHLINITLLICLPSFCFLNPLFPSPKPPPTASRLQKPRPFSELATGAPNERPTGNVAPADWGAKRKGQKCCMFLFFKMFLEVFVPLLWCFPFFCIFCCWGLDGGYWEVLLLPSIVYLAQFFSLVLMSIHWLQV